MPIEYDTGWRVKDSRAWQEQQRPIIKERVQALSNEDLVDAYTSFAGGDDYDGCYTLGGKVVWEELKVELEARLVTCGFLEGNDANSSN